MFNLNKVTTRAKKLTSKNRMLCIASKGRFKTLAKISNDKRKKKEKNEEHVKKVVKAAKFGFKFKL